MDRFEEWTLFLDTNKSNINFDLACLYEKFLAQTNNQYRKSKGIFYTPKFIADYMVKNVIDKFIKNKLYKDICQIKIIDPSCGGGIFLISAFEYLEKIHSNFLNVEKLEFNQRKQILCNSIYGVDIDPIAIKICKNLLLSKLYNTANIDIIEYDFLDLNIKSGNSLISKFAIKDNVFERVTNFQKKLQEYKNWVSIYKNEYDKGAKNVLKNKIDSFKKEFNLVDPRIKEIDKKIDKKSEELLLKYKSDLLFNSDLNEKQKAEKQQLKEDLKLLITVKENIISNPIYKNAFEWRFEFPEVLDYNGDFIGFDVVIGNPPYISNKEILNSEKLILQNYKIAKEQYDLYSLFIEKGLQISNQNALNSMIIPDSLLGRSNFKSARMFLNKNALLVDIIHLDNVFDEASVSSCIYFLHNKKTEVHPKINYIKANNVKNWLEGNFQRKQISYLTNEMINSYRLLFLNETEYNLLLKIFKNEPLINYIESWRGEEIGKKNEFILNEKIPNSVQIITGENIDRYLFKKEKKYISLKNVSKDIKKYNQEKIVIRQLGSKINAHLDIEKSISVQSVYNLYSINNEYSNMLILGLLNSNLFNFIYKSVFSEKQQFPRILLENIRSLCVPICNLKTFSKIEKLVNHIIILKKENPLADISVLENEIDEIVYQLFNLTNEEIEIVKNSL